MKAFLCLAVVLVIGQVGNAYNKNDPNLAMPDKKKTQVCVWYVVECNNDNRTRVPYSPFLIIKKENVSTWKQKQH